MVWAVALWMDDKLAVIASHCVQKDKMQCVLDGFQTMAEARTFKWRVQKNYTGPVVVRFVRAVCTLVRNEPHQCHSLDLEFCRVVELPPELQDPLWKLSRAFLFKSTCFA